VVVIDSVGWLAFFTGDALAIHYRPFLLSTSETILCPTIVLYEVTKRMELTHGRQAAMVAAAQLLQKQVIPLDEALATLSAHISIAYKLAMADAIIYATAQLHQATLITSDAHFASLPGVKYYPQPQISSN